MFDFCQITVLYSFMGWNVLDNGLPLSQKGGGLKTTEIAGNIEGHVT